MVQGILASLRSYWAKDWRSALAERSKPDFGKALQRQAEMRLAQVQRNRRRTGTGLLLGLLLLLPIHSAAEDSNDKKANTVTVPVLLLDGGRKLVFEGTISTEKDVKPKRGFFKKILDVMVGAPDVHFMVRPFSVVTDSRGRIIVTDPGAGGVHIFDLKEQKYKFLTRKDKTKEAMTTPQCVAVDAQDNIYVTDSELGKIFVFEPSGKFSRVIGSLKHGEGYFKHPTGIAVDSGAQRIYVSDTWRDEIFVMDMQGSVLQKIGKSGSGDGEFNFPTELRLDGPNLMVLDAMNFRVQVLDRSGGFQYSIGKLGDGRGDMFRPKGLGIDSEGHLYIVEGMSGVVQVFDRQGQLLYYFGKRGTGFGNFQLPTGLFIDRADHVYVVDSFNRRVQMFRYFAPGKQAAGGGQ
jgi:DNA-binding beta-propeller fold protein YncE